MTTKGLRIVVAVAILFGVLTLLSGGRALFVVPNRAGLASVRQSVHGTSTVSTACGNIAR